MFAKTRKPTKKIFCGKGKNRSRIVLDDDVADFFTADSRQLVCIAFAHATFFVGMNKKFLFYFENCGKFVRLFFDRLCG